MDRIEEIKQSLIRYKLGETGRFNIVPEVEFLLARVKELEAAIEKHKEEVFSDTRSEWIEAREARLYAVLKKGGEGR